MNEFEIKCLEGLLRAFRSTDKDNMEFEVNQGFAYTVPDALRKAIELLKTNK